MSRERGDDGRDTETVTLQDVLGVFRTIEGPVVTSADVAEALGMSSPGATPVFVDTPSSILTVISNRGLLPSVSSVDNRFES